MAEIAKRFNGGKIDYSLLPAKACEHECRVWMSGQLKYGKSNWKKLWGEDTIDVVMASLLRHAFAILDGQEIDPESGEYHAAHIRCNAAMLIEYYERNKAEGGKYKIDNCQRCGRMCHVFPIDNIQVCKSCIESLEE
jgi:hypothetical protein